MSVAILQPSGVLIHNSTMMNGLGVGFWPPFGGCNEARRKFGRTQESLRQPPLVGFTDNPY
jgi:hypothetical protein